MTIPALSPRSVAQAIGAAAPRLALALMLALLALIAAGCQSLPAPLQQRAAGTTLADGQLGTALAASIDAIARGRDRPKALASAELQHRRLLADHLPLLVGEATPARPNVGVAQEDALLDPAAYQRLTPVLRSRPLPAGLQRTGIGLPVVARLPAPQDPNAPRAGYDLPATWVVQPGDGAGRIDPAPRADQATASAADVEPASTPGRAITTKGTACCEAALVDPTRVEQLPTASGTLPVAMDLLAPIAATRATGVTPMTGIANLLWPRHFAGDPRIVFLRPFDPDKTPVVLVHGLLSTPGVWAPLVAELEADPRIRACCQLWFFYYPTGQPVPLSALQLREALNAAVAHRGLDRPMILVGHSMGGILSRAQVSRMTPARAEAILPGVSQLPDYNRLRRALIFEPRNDVSRAIFLFTPHRGSRLASNSLGALVIRLIRLPDTLVSEMEQALQQLAGGSIRRVPTSIQGLSPGSAFLRALDDTRPTVPVHSILGNRGRGDGTSGSDGVVPVRSARLAAAESELIVPTGHGGFGHPAAVAEIKRIILQDVAQQRASSEALEDPRGGAGKGTNPGH